MLSVLLAGGSSLSLAGVNVLGSDGHSAATFKGVCVLSLKDKTTGTTFVGSGVLIRNKIITAAHVVKDRVLLKAGCFQVGWIDIKGAQIIPNSSYGKSIGHDTAVIILNKKYNSNVNLPSVDEAKGLLKNPQKLFWFGFGMPRGEVDLKHYHAVLTGGRLGRIISASGNSKTSPEQHFATQDAESYVRYGDSGGPVVGVSNGKAVLVAIISMSDENHYISVFEKITPYLKSINSNGQ